MNMQSAVAKAEPRAVPYSTKRYAAFIVGDVGFNSPKWRTRSIDIGSPSSLQEALTAATTQACQHKDRLLIEEVGDDRRLLHVYAIKKRAPRWVHPAGEIMPRRIEELYAELVCVVDRAVLG